MNTDTQPSWIFTSWERVAPTWQFWNRQERTFVRCAAPKCSWEASLSRKHSSTMSAIIAEQTLRMQMIIHRSECKIVQKVDCYDCDGEGWQILDGDEKGDDIYVIKIRNGVVVDSFDICDECDGYGVLTEEVIE